jgi:hypothetical protein
VTGATNIGGIVSRVDRLGRLDYHNITIDGLTNGNKEKREFVFSSLDGGAGGGTVNPTAPNVNNTE